MSEQASLRDGARAQMDEQRLARGIAIGLPIVTISVAAVVGVLVGPATSILVFAAGILLGVIALLWGSLRILSGDATLPPELEALDMAAQGNSVLASRKKMLLRALKDLENEHAIGKIEDEDYEQLASTYREELKVVLKRIDESLAPHRSKAEEAARAYLVKVGLADAGYRGELAPKEDDVRAEADASEKKKPAAKDRVLCSKCGASNERDAKFCKECATKLVSKADVEEKVSASSESEDVDEA